MKTSTEMMDVFHKPYAQMMKMMSPGKEKEMMENMVNSIDKIGEYQMKQAQLQYLLYTTSQNAMEKAIHANMNKTTDSTEISNFNLFFNEWVGITEKTFTELFATDEFSQLKAEVTTLAMSIKKDYDTQLTSQFENTPFAFKADMDEVYKNLYDLKKMVKQMQKMLEISEEEVEIVEAKPTKAKKK
jgi:hypothetical protein